jgi:hypothetical protein
MSHQSEIREVLNYLGTKSDDQLFENIIILFLTFFQTFYKSQIIQLTIRSYT